MARFWGAVSGPVGAEWAGGWRGALAVSTTSCFGVCCWLFIGNRRGSLSGQEDEWSSVVCEAAFNLLKCYIGTCLESQWFRLGAFTVGAWIQSLVRELRSHMLCGMAKIKKKKRAVQMLGAIIDSASIMEYLPCTRHSIGSRGQIRPKPPSSLSHRANRS